MSESKILVIVGTTRQGRSGRKIADWYIKEAKKVAPAGVELELLDIADFSLPVFNEAVPPMYHQYNETQEAIAAKVGAADGFVFVTGEYNHTIPSSLKNFLEYINAEWHHKAAAFVGYGSTGGVRSIEHLIQILAELRVASIATSGDHIHINAPWEGLEEDGTPKEGYVHGDIAKQLTELSWWTNALKAARS
jgi:NAD(P)H-dependent FMN reductase